VGAAGGGPQGKDVLDGAMAAAMNDISQEMIKNGTNGTVVSALTHYCKAHRGLHVRRESLVVVPRSRAIICRSVPNLSVTIRNFYVAAHVKRPISPGGEVKRTLCADIPRQTGAGGRGGSGARAHAEDETGAGDFGAGRGVRGFGDRAYS
jgi:hypothetical protein